MVSESTSDERETEAPKVDAEGQTTSRVSKRSRSLLVVVAVVAGVMLAALLLDRATTSPALCGSCHEMEMRYQSWEQSAHNPVTCVECHEQPHPWYAVPQRLVARGALLIRDVGSHLSGDYDDPVDGPSAQAEPIADEVCLQCHDANRTATSGYRILIDHVEHAKRNGSCVSCHIRTAHPIESRSWALTLMAKCFECHGDLAQPEASSACELCHPEDYELLPASHEDQEWELEHGATFADDAQQCAMCHDAKTCDDCHGIEMPHPEGWAKGRTGHSLVATVDRAVCSRCHGGQLEMCTMCHHTGYDPSKGTWVKHHFIQVRERGAGSCMETCHSPLFCVTCHMR